MGISEMEKAILENPLLILDRPVILSALKKHWVAGHANLTDPEQFVDDFFNYLLTTGVKLDKRAINKFHNKKLKEYWKEGAGLGKPKDMFLEIMDSAFLGMETVLDFGCGKLALLRELAENNAQLKKLIGVDLKSSPVLEGVDKRIEFQRDLQNIKKKSVDLAVIKLVLHHLENLEEIKIILSGIRDVLRSGGKLLLLEESFPLINAGGMEGQIQEIRKYLSQFHLELSDVTADFLGLSVEDKNNFLFLNDWLMNTQNSYMPWTGMYQSMEEWAVLGEELGFSQKEAHFLGAIAHRKRKQGMTAYLVWEK